MRRVSLFAARPYWSFNSFCVASRPPWGMVSKKSNSPVGVSGGI
jgi:hypothetical protein